MSLQMYTTQFIVLIKGILSKVVNLHIRSRLAGGLYSEGMYSFEGMYVFANCFLIVGGAYTWNYTVLAVTSYVDIC